MSTDLLSFLPHLVLSLTVMAALPFSAFAAPANQGASDPASLQSSADASKQWLSLIDKGNYSESWEAASALLKTTLQKEGWEKLMQETRKPLGNAISREVLDQRTAKNPHGMPKGDYIVMFYKTKFAKKDSVYELLTLFFENGHWKVVTYQLDQGNQLKK